MRHFVVVSRHGSAAGDFSLDDLPGTSGRLDVGLRSVRAALLVSHGVRQDAVVYLVLEGGPRAPRILRFRGGEARFLRPDERSLAVLAKKVLASQADDSAGDFVEVRPGVAIARGGVDRVLSDLRGAPAYLLEEGGLDLREVEELDREDAAFFLGDSTGMGDGARARIAAAGAVLLSVGPVGVHAEDAVAIVSNELDRRLARR